MNAITIQAIKLWLKPFSNHSAPPHLIFSIIPSLTLNVVVVVHIPTYSTQYNNIIIITIIKQQSVKYVYKTPYHQYANVIYVCFVYTILNPMFYIHVYRYTYTLFWIQFSYTQHILTYIKCLYSAIFSQNTPKASRKIYELVKNKLIQK